MEYDPFDHRLPRTSSRILIDSGSQAIIRFTREEDGWMSDQESIPTDSDGEGEDLIYNISSGSDTGSIISEGYHTEISDSE